MNETTQTNSDFPLTDIVSMKDFTRKEIDYVLETAKKMENMPKDEKKQILKNKTAGVLFFEPSTRTRLSFETSIQNLGGRVVGFADAGVSSSKKGESLSDTIRTVERYVDLIVMRHYLQGTARRAAEVAKIPIINGGDGANQHPTQTLLDLYTIQKEFGNISGLKIGFCGDLKYGRTVHSLAWALTHFNVKQYYIAPESLAMPDYITKKVRQSQEVHETESMDEFLPELDVLYMTRIQKERFPSELEYEKMKGVYIFKKAHLKKVKPSFRLMHPLPRVNEIATDIDSTKHALYFDQLANGLPVREALVSILSKVRK